MSSRSPSQSPRDTFESEHEDASAEPRVVEMEDGDAAQPSDELDDLFGSDNGSVIDDSIKESRSRRRKRTDEDDASIDEMIIDLRKRMREAAYRDIDDKKEHLPAIHKLSMLQDVVDELGKTQLYEAFLDNNIVDSIRLWLEPLDDGSLPSLDIQNAMLGALKRLPIRRDHLRESGIGKIILFMSKCPQIPERNRRICEQFVQQWSRMVMRLSSDFRDRKIREATVDLTQAYKHGPRKTTEAASIAASKRRAPGGIRVESSSGRGGERSTARIPQRVAADYTVMPVSSISLSPSQPSPSRIANDRFKKLRQTMNRSGR
ncbi:Transcription factor iws1 [Coemansia interrupta]|uniref:Transcription factor iws1 n=1 Tax=Coemansia interrupta TaxID=1126814 RepID=A0A9W8LNA8_9FUNG|nr:Transcription factor iws1 [Coemansia interrupta]